MTAATPNDPEAIALAALAATLAEERRAQRFLSLSGISPDDLRAQLGQKELLAAVLAFLEAHEPDLLAVAEAMRVKPETLVAAREALER